MSVYARVEEWDKINLKSIRSVRTRAMEDHGYWIANDRYYTRQ